MDKIFTVTEFGKEMFAAYSNLNWVLIIGAAVLIGLLVITLDESK
jgi:hypothetical protein